ncbi:MAG: Dabb family protein [Pirellulales bacterium]
MTLVNSARATAAEKPPRLLRHIVMYKYKDDLTPAQVQEVIDAFVALPAKIDTIVGFEHGENVSPEGKSDGLTHAFVVTFKDEQGRATYLDHPAHLEYVKLAGPRRDKVVVFDYWSSE